MRRLFSSLKLRFLICYLLLTIVPIAILYGVTYAGAVRQAQQEIISVQTEAMASNRLYLQYLLMSMESRYYQLASCSALEEIMDGSARTERMVMYNYVREVASLVKETALDIDMIDSVSFYTGNRVAARILPRFYSLDSLNDAEFPESYAANPTRALFRHFWCVEEDEEGKTLTYYAGLMDQDIQRLNGVIALRCKQDIWDVVFSGSEDSDASFFFLDGTLAYTRNATEETEALARAENLARLSDTQTGDISIEVNREAGTVMCWFRLPSQSITVFIISPMPLMVRIPVTFWITLLVLVLLALLLMMFFFQPLFNITLLAQHMKSVQSIPIQPFPHTSDTSEIKTIITEYNALVQRINELAKTVNQKELLLRNAQIERLQSQLNPHFFYGTLESIRMIAEIDGHAEIAEIAYDFSTLMRYSLSRDFFVPLEREIDIVNKYVAIQTKRVGGRFTMEWDIAVASKDWRCPKFVLFSLVENAFTHDVNRTRSTVHIRVKIQENGDELVFSVWNDGPGIAAERLRELRHLLKHPQERRHFASQNNGRSIFNINDRLQFYYGEDFCFDIDSRANEYTLCVVKISRFARFLGQEETEDAEDHAD